MTKTKLTWNPFLNSKNYLYAYEDVGGKRVAYYVHTLSDTHPIEEYRNRWTADVSGVTLYEYRPAKTPIFFDSLEDAQAACERDLSTLRERWQAMLEESQNNPQLHQTFASIL